MDRADVGKKDLADAPRTSIDARATICEGVCIAPNDNDDNARGTAAPKTTGWVNICQGRGVGDTIGKGRGLRVIAMAEGRCTGEQSKEGVGRARKIKR
jgi:hypothetical protein